MIFLKENWDNINQTRLVALEIWQRDRGSRPEVFWRNRFLEISLNSQKNTSVWGLQLY